MSRRTVFEGKKLTARIFKYSPNTFCCGLYSNRIVNLKDHKPMANMWTNSYEAARDWCKSVTGLKAVVT